MDEVDANKEKCLPPVNTIVSFLPPGLKCADKQTWTIENSFSKSEKKTFISLTVTDSFYTILGYHIKLSLNLNSAKRFVEIEAKTVNTVNSGFTN